MFLLTQVSDMLRLEPSTFSKNVNVALEDDINRKYSNKIIHNVGLCICFHDLLSMEDGLMKPGDGAAFVKVTFRLIVFRPFVGEILVGWVSSCTPEGLHVKMEFFDDIYIPKSMLFDECIFVAKEQAWVWQSGGHDFYIDTNEKIRFRVEQEFFTQHNPQKNPNLLENTEEPANTNQVPPYSILGSCQADGMGLVSWWEAGDEEEMEQDGDEVYEEATEAAAQEAGETEQAEA